MKNWPRKTETLLVLDFAVLGLILYFRRKKSLFRDRVRRRGLWRLPNDVVISTGSRIIFYSENTVWIWHYFCKSLILKLLSLFVPRFFIDFIYALIRQTTPHNDWFKVYVKYGIRLYDILVLYSLNIKHCWVLFVASGKNINYYYIYRAKINYTNQ